MSKYTLLDMTQRILNDLDADEVGSIDDTVESQQVASIIEQCYFEQIANRNWPHLQELVQLESSIDSNKPTHMKLPERMKEMIFFNYDVQKEDDNRLVYREVKYKYPDEFLRFISGRNGTVDTVRTIIDFSGTKLLITNNAAPQFWTSFDDEYVVLDSYDEQVDTTLQSDKTQCLAYMDPVWEQIDDFIPDLPSEAFPALLEEAKSTAFLALKQMANQKAEQKASRQQRWLSRKAWKAKGGVRYPDYGRASRK